MPSASAKYVHYVPWVLDYDYAENDELSGHDGGQSTPHVDISLQLLQLLSCEAALSRDPLSSQIAPHLEEGGYGYRQHQASAQDHLVLEGVAKTIHVFY